MLDWILGLFSKGGLPIRDLERRLDVTEAQLRDVNASYHQFSIKKKSGKSRQIAAPNRELKSLQRRILRRLLAKLKTHPAATGFQPGISFVDNARCHQSQKVIVRVDIVDFFPSIKSDVVQNYFEFIGWSKSAAQLLTTLTTHQGGLPQGAPTSPRLSNLVNVKLDAEIYGKLRRIDPRAVYTRYADDITISSSNDSFNPSQAVKAVLESVQRFGYQPHLNKKLDVKRQHHRQVVTGLVVNEHANLAREKRRWLRSVKHRMKLKEQGGYLGPSPSLTREQLDGWLNLQKMIEQE